MGEISELTVKQGEVKSVVIKVTREGVRLNLTDVELMFQIKRRKGDSTALVTKEDTDFDKTNAANGIVSFVLTEEDTNLPPSTGYVGEIKFSFPDGTIDKSDDIRVIVQQAVIT